ncbi:MAG: cwlT [Acidimicrobiales bacterium]|nr:cwlT [Acidimicrobiales bacterium]
MKSRRPALVLLSVALVAMAGLAACQPAQTPGTQAVAAARSQIGMPYRSGGESVAEGGFDCSGLISYAWAKAGVTLPRSASSQYAGTRRITSSDLRAGDLVFYSSSGPGGAVSHVAMYTGNGTIVHARKPGVPVQEIADTFWADHRVGFGRVGA